MRRSTTRQCPDQRDDRSAEHEKRRGDGDEQEVLHHVRREQRIARRVQRQEQCDRECHETAYAATCPRVTPRPTPADRRTFDTTVDTSVPYQIAARPSVTTIPSGGANTAHRALDVSTAAATSR